MPKPSVWTSLVQTGDSLRVEHPPLTATPAHMPAPERLTLGSVARDWLRDAAQIWSSPFQGKSQDLLPLCAMALTVAVLIPNDERVNHVMTDVVVDHDRDDAISPLVSQMGSYGAWGAVGAFFGFGLLAKDQKAVETASLAVSAMLQSELVVGLAKMVTGRQRPSAGNGVDSWGGPAGFFRHDSAGQTMSFDSFPSGHTATAFSLATVVAMQYHDHPWVPIAAYAIATGVGFSRLSGNHHWLSDVVVGAVLGHVIARLVIRNYHLRHGIQPMLSVSPRGVSLGASYSFR